MLMDLERQWNRQPSNDLQLNNWLTRRESVVWVGSKFYSTSGRNQLQVYPSGPNPTKIEVSQFGTGFGTGDSNGDMLPIVSNVSTLFPYAEGTIAIFRQCKDTVLRTSSVFGGEVTSSNRLLSHAPYSDGTFYFDWGSASTGRISVAQTKTTLPELLVFTNHPIDGQRMYRNGNVIASGSHKNFTLNGYGFNLGTYTASSSGDNQIIYLAVMSARAWSHQEILEWSRSTSEVYSKTFQPFNTWVSLPLLIGGIPFLSSATYVPGSINGIGFRPRVTATFS